MRQNDVINDDVIEKWKMFKIQNFLFFSRENIPGNKKYYYERAWKSLQKTLLAKIDIFKFCLLSVDSGRAQSSNLPQAKIKNINFG